MHKERVAGMQVLTATIDTQGWRDNDFCWTVEGEMVFFAPFDCARVHRRWLRLPPSMAGLVSHRATTTVKVVERPDLDEKSYFLLIADGLESQGYVTEELMRNPNVAEWVHDLADELTHAGPPFPVGSVLERRGDVMFMWTDGRKQG
jgi:hypothetical protein